MSWLQATGREHVIQNPITVFFQSLTQTSKHSRIASSPIHEKQTVVVDDNDSQYVSLADITTTNVYTCLKEGKLSFKVVFVMLHVHLTDFVFLMTLESPGFV